MRIDNKRAERLGLFAALAFAVCYSSLALRAAFRLPLLVADDARQHVFWMERFLDPSLFPNDLIADYFQAVAPAGYKSIYWAFAKLGLDPLLLAKFLPAFLGIVIAYLAFRLFMQIASDPRGAFVASVLFCQAIWLKDDVISATPRAFSYPLFLAFLLFVLQRRVIAGLVVLALEGLIYPQAALVSLAVLFLRGIKWKGRHTQFSRDRVDHAFAIGGLLIAAIVFLPFAASASKYGPVIGRAEAISLPEFLSHGRSQFFGGFQLLLGSARAGLFPIPFSLPMAVLAVVAPLLFLFSARVRSRLNGKGEAVILLQVLAAGIGMWILAHLFLFKLHLPGRYSQMAFRVVIPLAAPFTFSTLWELVPAWRKHFRHRLTSHIPVVLVSLLGVLLLLYPHLRPKFARRSYNQASPKELYDFLRTQPKQSVIATIERCGDFIPVFARRPVLVSPEYAVPYHLGYYRQVRQRGQDLVRAILTSDVDVLRAFIENYDIDLFILGRASITPQSLKKYPWFSDIVATTEIEWPDQPPVLSSLAERSKVWENENYIVLDAHLVSEMIRPNEISPPR